MFKLTISCYLLLLLWTMAQTNQDTCRTPDWVSDRIKPFTSLESESRSIMLDQSNTIPSVYHHNITRTTVLNLTHCQTGRAKDNERSICPWVFVENKDENRIPEIMFEAKCSTGRCNESQRGSECKEIYHYVSVLRKGRCINGEYVYERILERLASGCGCFRVPTCQRGGLGTRASGISGNPVSQE